MPDHGFRGDYWRVKPNKIRVFATSASRKCRRGSAREAGAGFLGIMRAKAVSRRFPLL